MNVSDLRNNGDMINVGSNREQTVKHLVIAVSLGRDDSIEMLMYVLKLGFVRKVDLAAAIRAHQAAVDATKSPQRDAAEEHRRSKGTFW